MKLEKERERELQGERERQGKKGRLKEEEVVVDCNIEGKAGV